MLTTILFVILGLTLGAIAITAVAGAVMLIVLIWRGIYLIFKD